MKPSLKETVQEKLMADPQFSAIINNFKSVVQLTTEQINITRERVSLDYPELDQAINDDNFTKAFYTYYCLSECSSENCRMV
jgi:hypothetical protein